MHDMLSHATGSIVNTSSTSSLLGKAVHSMVHHVGTKGFVNSFSKLLTWEWVKKGVQVNTICPGWIFPHDADHSCEGSFWNRFGFEWIGNPSRCRRILRPERSST